MKVDGCQRMPKKCRVYQKDHNNDTEKCHYLRSFEDLIKARKLKEFLTLEANTRRQGNVLIEETSNEPGHMQFTLQVQFPKETGQKTLDTLASSDSNQERLI